MSGRLSELQAILAEVRRRWTRRSLLRAWVVGAAATTTVLLATLGVVLLAARDGIPLLVTAAVSLGTVAFVIARTLWPFRNQPTDARVARFIEETVDGLDDVLVTTVDYASRADAPERMRELVASDALRVVEALDLDRVVSRASSRQALVRAAAASVALIVVATLVAPSFGRAVNVAAAYLIPTRIALDVSPGSTKVRAGEPVTITARVGGFASGLTPTLTVSVGEKSRDVQMAAGAAPAVFVTTINNVTTSFEYSVAAAHTHSDLYAVSVVRPARVERIDVHYEFPRGLGLEPRTDEDSGDIYGPEGTNVRLTITADKPIERASLVLNDGNKIALASNERMLEGGLTIQDDGSYRVALVDADGLESTGDTEYFIRTLDDRPPDVRILRPAGDKQVTPLEEVLIEARADDDYGIASFDLVFQAPGGKERVVPFRGAKGGVTIDGRHTMFLESLNVQPGDFVTYYARARDLGRGRRTAEARSDIFFLEVKPFEEEFVAAQSQAMMGGGGGDRGLQDLAEAQKQIIVATWKLDARSRRARDARSAEDIKAVGKAQAELKKRAEQAAGQFSRAATDPRRRRGAPAITSGSDPMAFAVEAMGRAVTELDKLATAPALPHEMEALNQLLKAEAEIRRRQVARDQQAGGGGGMNRSQADLSSLFDRELRKRQETNYETPNNSTEQRAENKESDLLEKIRELARRQEALNRQQRDLSRNREQIEQDELKRELQRLSREQNQLRQEAEQLARQMSSSRQQSQSQSGGQGSEGQSQQEGKKLREISEDMRNAATGMGRQNDEQTNSSAQRAADRLRDLERQMQMARPDDRRRALGDMQLETRQLADAQRRLASEAGRAASGQAGEDARRRLAGEQERLAQRAERLKDNAQRLARGGQADGEQRKATEDAARELDRQRIPDRMRESADALRRNESSGQSGQPNEAARQASRQGEDVARALDRIADRIGAASGNKDAESRKLSDQLSRTHEARERVAELQRKIEQLQREGDQNQRAGNSPQGQRGQQSSEQANAQGQRGQNGQSGQSQNGQQAQNSGSQSSGEGREGSTGEQGGSDGGRGGRLQEMQREVNEGIRELARLTDQIRRDNPDMRGGKTPEEWWRSFSAPGTEAFKQDFARWESLKQQLLAGFEQVESQLSDQLRTRENQERLNAGGHEAVSEQYRELVEKYYRSLAAPRKPQH